MNGNSSATFSSQGAAPVCQCQVKSVLLSMPVMYLEYLINILVIVSTENKKINCQVTNSHILSKSCVLLQIPAMHIVKKERGEEG